MKMNIHIRPRRQNAKGSATIIVVVVMFILAALAVNNSRSIAQLNRELRLIEARQIGKYTQPVTKAPAPASKIPPQKGKE